MEVSVTYFVISILAYVNNLIFLVCILCVINRFIPLLLMMYNKQNIADTSWLLLNAEIVILQAMCFRYQCLINEVSSVDIIIKR